MAEDHQIGDAPIEDQYRETMRALAHGIDEILNGPAKGADRKTGFVLLVFPFGKRGRCNYISNGSDRADIVPALEEQLVRFKDQPEVADKLGARSQLLAQLFEVVEKSQEILATYVTPPGPYDFPRADKAISDLLGVLDAQDLVVAMRAAKA